MTARPGAVSLRDGARTMVRAAMLIAVALRAPAVHGGVALGLPLDCQPGATCWIANYVDLDGGRGVADYRCGRLTYDGHKGTDFAIRDLEVMRGGVAVVAAAAGTVEAVRDGAADRSVRETGATRVEGRECGNGVRIDHGDGLVTQYCHLREGSVRVRRGAQVSAGQPLGLVGLSGQTEFPHVHVTVYRNGAVVDPFSGRTAAQGCGTTLAPLWAPTVVGTLPYARRQVYHLGVAGEAPTAERVRAGEYARAQVRSDAPVLAVWMEAFGVAAGDRVRLAIVGPDGRSVVSSDAALEKDLARVLRWAAKRRGSAPWPVGSYRLTAEILPVDGSAPSSLTMAVQVHG